MLGRALKSAREHRDLTQLDVAKALKVSRAAVSQWEAGTTEPSTENLINVCELLGISLEAATGGMVQHMRLEPPIEIEGKIFESSITDRRPEMRNIENEVRRSMYNRVPDRASLPSDVPVYGVAVGGSDAEFLINGEIVDYVRRPDGILRARDVYAIYVVGSSMAPRFEEGELVYVSPSRPVSIGDYVVIQLKPKGEAEPKKALIKRLSRRSPANVTLEQFNPANTFKIDIHNIDTIHRVIPWTELLGA